jgi:hypothetical protein
MPKRVVEDADRRRVRGDEEDGGERDVDAVGAADDVCEQARVRIGRGDGGDAIGLHGHEVRTAPQRAVFPRVRAMLARMCRNIEGDTAWWRWSDGPFGSVPPLPRSIGALRPFERRQLVRHRKFGTWASTVS